MSTALQRTAAEQALGIALPHRRMEEWRWTDLRRAITWNYETAATQASSKSVGEVLSLSPFRSIAKSRIAFVDGQYSKEHSTISGFELLPLEGELKIDDPLLEMNAAMKAKGVALHFSGNIDQLVEIAYLSTGIAKQADAYRVKIEIADDASASVVESFFGIPPGLTNTVTEIHLGKRSRLDRIKYQMDGEKATHLSHVIYNLSEEARLNDLTVTRGAGLTRQNGVLNFNGPNADAKISGAYLLKGKQHADTALKINHNVPHCTSRELFKCVMDDEARGIFQGKVFVAKHAQKTDGKQSSHALLLTERAEFDAKPELEIYADDVVCGHGATAGDLNHDHLFYLKSRGIPEAEAKSLLIAAFVGEAFDMVANEQAREALVDLAARWVTST